MKDVILKNEKIKLRFICKEDTANIIRWRNQDEVRKNFLYQKLFTEEVHIKWLNEMVFQGKVEQFIIYDNEQEKPVGTVFLRDIDYINKKAEYGIFIGEKGARGKGIGSEAAKLIVKYGFENLNLHKIFLRVFATNQKAIHSYQKAGFEKEAYLKDEVLVNNKYEDIILMAKINSGDENKDK